MHGLPHGSISTTHSSQVCLRSLFPPPLPPLRPRRSSALAINHFSILVLKRKWGEKILSGEKTIEIRRGRCLKRERIGLCYSGTESIYGFVDVVDSIGPFNKSEWCAHRDRHRVPGDNLPYGTNTCGWVMANPKRLATPLKVAHKNGVVKWQTVIGNVSQHEQGGSTLL